MTEPTRFDADMTEGTTVSDLRFARMVYDSAVKFVAEDIGDREAVMAMLFAAAYHARNAGFAQSDFERWAGHAERLFRGRDH
jgi:hypothetical protein